MALLAAPLGVGRANESPGARLGVAHTALVEGRAKEAAGLLGKLLTDKNLVNRDYALFFLGEAELASKASGQARKRFTEVAGMKSSRLRVRAAFRAADALWEAGRTRDAAREYERLLDKGTTARKGTDAGDDGVLPGDGVLAMFRIAEARGGAAGKPDAKAEALYRKLAAEHPGHELAERAVARLAKLALRAGAQTGTATDAMSSALPPRQRLARAEILTKQKKWTEALDELAALPAELPAELANERDYQTGMTKFRMRRDYARAGELLLAVAPKLGGERRESAMFHGARALSRADRDDEAIAGYQALVRERPHSRWSPEAQYLSGWLEFNRKRYRESLPALADTVTRYRASPFAADAAWYTWLAHYFLGNTAAALEALDRFASIARGDDGRTIYWRARLLAQQGRATEAADLWRTCVQRHRLGYYGLAAAARLRAAGEKAPPPLPQDTGGAVPPLGKPVPSSTRDPAVRRADELIEASLRSDAAAELERDESGVFKRLGEAAGLATLFDRYERAEAPHRPYRLAEGRRGGGALEVDPRGDTHARTFWQAAYPRAFATLVDELGPPAGNPDFFLYAIMRKESGFNPRATSYADARGLLQMIPPTSETVARRLGIAYAPDDLWDPTVNVRLGAAYVGSLVKMFGGQEPLAAGAFNAGPRAMSRWCAAAAGRPMDEFVELIAFKQTREYVKLVIGNYARYRYLYTDKPYELPLTVDTRVQKDTTGLAEPPTPDDDAD